MQEVDARPNISSAVWANSQTCTVYCALQYSEFQKNRKVRKKYWASEYCTEQIHVHVYMSTIPEKPMWVVLKWDRAYSRWTSIEYLTVNHLLQIHNGLWRTVHGSMGTFRCYAITSFQKSLYIPFTDIPKISELRVSVDKEHRYLSRSEC